MNKKQRKRKEKKARTENAAKKAAKSNPAVGTQRIGYQYQETERTGHGTQTPEKNGENRMELKKWMQQPSSSNWVIAGLTCALVAIGVVQALIYCGQLHAIHVDQRPWMKFVNADKIVPLSRNTTAMGAAQVSNPGKTPARNVRIEIAVEKVKNGEQPTMSLGSNDVVSTSGLAYPDETEPAQGIQFGVRGDTNKPFDFIPLGDDYDRWTKGELFYVVYGRISYSDFFRVEHWTHYCVFVASPPPPGHPPYTFTAQRCTEYNDVDDN
jgi:hypothetical protein